MEKPSTARLALKWGLITALITILFSTFLYFTGYWKIQMLTSVMYLVIIIGIVMAMREFKSLNNGFMSYGEGLGLGALMSAVSGLISGIFNYVYTNFIDTTMMPQMLELQRTRMEERGLTEEQIDQAMQITQKFMTPGFTFLIGVLILLIFGFIVSLVISAILRKNKPEMDF